MQHVKLILFCLCSILFTISASASNNDDGSDKKKKNQWQTVHKGKGYTKDELAKRRDRERARQVQDVPDNDGKIIKLLPEAYRSGQNLKQAKNVLKKINDTEKGKLIDLLKVMPQKHSFRALECFQSILVSCKGQSAPQLHYLLREVKQKGVSNREARIDVLEALTRYAQACSGGKKKKKKERPTPAHLVNLLKSLIVEPDKAPQICQSLLELESTSDRGNIVFIASEIPVTYRLKVLMGMVGYKKKIPDVNISQIATIIKNIKSEHERGFFLDYLLTDETLFSKAQHLASLVEIHFEINKNLTPPSWNRNPHFIYTRLSSMCDFLEAGEKVLAPENLKNLMKYLMNNFEEVELLEELYEEVFEGRSRSDILGLVEPFIRLTDLEGGVCETLLDIEKRDADDTIVRLVQAARLLESRTQSPLIPNRRALVELIHTFLEFPTIVKTELVTELAKTHIQPAHTLEQRLLLASYVSRNQKLSKKERIKGAQRLLAAGTFEEDLFYIFATEEVGEDSDLDILIDAWEKIGPKLSKSQALKEQVRALSRRSNHAIKHLSIVTPMLASIEPEQMEVGLENLFQLVQAKTPLDPELHAEVFAHLPSNLNLIHRACIYRVLCWERLDTPLRKQIIERLMTVPAEEMTEEYYETLRRFTKVTRQVTNAEDVFDYIKLSRLVPNSWEIDSYLSYGSVKVLRGMFCFLTGLTSQDLKESSESDYKTVFSAAKDIACRDREQTKIENHLVEHFLSEEYLKKLSFDQRLFLVQVLKNSNGAVEEVQAKLDQLNAIKVKIPPNWRFVDLDLEPDLLEMIHRVIGKASKQDLADSEVDFEVFKKACQIFLNKKNELELHPHVLKELLEEDFLGELTFKQKIDMAHFLLDMKGDAVELKQDIRTYLSLPERWKKSFIDVINDVDPVMFLPVLPSLSLIAEEFSVRSHEVGAHSKQSIIKALQDLSSKEVDTVALAKALKGHLAKVTLHKLRLLSVFDQKEWEHVKSDVVELADSFKDLTYNEEFSSQFLANLATCPDRGLFLKDMKGALASENSRKWRNRESNWEMMLKAYIAVPQQMRGKIFQDEECPRPGELVRYLGSFIKTPELKKHWSQQLDSKNRAVSNFFATLILDEGGYAGIKDDADNKDDKALYMKALSLKTTYLTEDLNSFELETADQASRYVLDNSRKLGLREDAGQGLPDYLLERARWVSYAVGYRNDTRNAYRIYNYLRAKRAQPFNFSLVKAPVSQTYPAIRFNPAGISSIKVHEVKVKDLPAFDQEFMTKMRTHILEEREVDKHEINEHVAILSQASTGHRQSLGALLKSCEPGGKLSSMLYELGGYESTVHTTTAKFVCIIAYLQGLSNERPGVGEQRELLSPREEMFLKMLSIIPYCEIRKSEGVNRFYSLLPEDAHLKGLIPYADSRDAKVREWVYPEVEKHIGNMFYAAHPFILDLCGINSADERVHSVHDITYTRNLMGGVVPLGSLEFDPYTTTDYVLSSKLTSRSLYNVLELFYKHLEVDPLVTHLMERLNKALSTKDSGAFDAIQNHLGGNIDNSKAWNLDEGVKITEYGTIQLLIALNILQQSAE